MSRSRLLLGTLLALAATAHAAEEAKKTWDVNSPPGERREIPIDVRSGTWMSVDVSPDGSRVLFDLLGDIYELPIAGGDAKSLTSGLAWDMQPLLARRQQHRVHVRSRGRRQPVADGPQRQCAPPAHQGRFSAC